MRALAALALVTLLCTPALAGWPAKGRCIPPWPSKSACIQVSPDDAAAIQRAIIAYVDASHRSDFAPAKKLASPIKDISIGQFLLYGYTYEGFKGDVLQAVAVETTDSGVETGFKVTLGREASAWRVLYFEHYHQHLPQPDAR